jgi:UDPglucose--hexose-1-phosphate uridylyltransferase
MVASEIRQNKATRQWVIYAPARGKRPKDFAEEQQERADLPELDESCPFCPGNEDELPEILMEHEPRVGEGWQARVVPNKFPALTPDAGSTEREREGIYRTMPAFGRHEVIIESPRHDLDIATMSLDAVQAVVETYHRRYVDLMRTHQNMQVILFRNHGPQAGTSLIHPHSQLVATGVVPQHIRTREQEAQRYFDEWGRCVFCDMLAYEVEEGARVIYENESFVAFVPFAAEVPFELWIMPRRHEADFGAISIGRQEDLAHALHAVLGLLRERLHDPDYNYVIHTAPQYKADEPHLHWYVQVQPRLTKQAGFEIGSGMRINPSIPEDDAAFLCGEE